MRRLQNYIRALSMYNNLNCHHNQGLLVVSNSVVLERLRPLDL